MAYSDYGGYAYRNGKRVIERSDATISPDGDVFGSPGMWPGFAAMAEGGKNEYERRKNWPSGHVVLGDGPIYVALYKQSCLMIYRGNEQLDEIALLVDPTSDAVSVYGESRYLNTDYFKSSNECCKFCVDGWTIEVFFRIEDNHYQYVKLTQPDGNFWHGWSGYGVGAGLEDCGYGYSTDDREEAMHSLWPESIAPATRSARFISASSNGKSHERIN
jgi:hypothetical protein